MALKEPQDLQLITKIKHQDQDHSIININLVFHLHNLVLPNVRHDFKSVVVENMH